MRLFSSIAADMRFQRRHGFYTVYAVVLLAYAILLNNIAAPYRADVTVLLIFSDTSVLGLFFVGAILLLEREQGVLTVLSVSPLRDHQYVVSKIISLTVIAVIMSCVLAVVGSSGIPGALFLVGVLATSTLYTAIGIAVATTATGLNDYFFSGAAWTLVFVFPLLGWFEVVESPVWWVLPTLPSLTLLSDIVAPVPWETALLSLVLLLVWDAVAVTTAVMRFRSHVRTAAGEVTS